MTSDVSSSPPPNPAEAYDANLVPTMFDPWADELLALVKPAVGEHVLDVACGTGAVSFKARDAIGPGGSVTGTDISPGMIAVARRKAAERGSDIEFVEVDAEHPPSRPGGFDLALCQQGLQFFPDSIEALTATRQVMRSGGRLGVAVWQPADKQDLVSELDQSISSRLDGAGGMNVPFSYGGRDRLIRELEAAGFTTIKVTSVSRKVHFPSAKNYVGMVLRAAASVMPDFAALGPDAIEQLAIDVHSDLAGVLPRFTDGEGLTFTLRADIGTAVA